MVATGGSTPGGVLPTPPALPRLALAAAPTCGSSLARWLPTCARACATRASAAIRLGLSCSAASINSLSVASPAARHQSANATALPACGSGAIHVGGAICSSGGAAGGAVAQPASTTSVAAPHMTRQRREKGSLMR